MRSSLFILLLTISFKSISQENNTKNSKKFEEDYSWIYEKGISDFSPSPVLPSQEIASNFIDYFKDHPFLAPEIFANLSLNYNTIIHQLENKNNSNRELLKEYQSAANYLKKKSTTFEILETFNSFNETQPISNKIFTSIIIIKLNENGFAESSKYILQFDEESNISNKKILNDPLFKMGNFSSEKLTIGKYTLLSIDLIPESTNPSVFINGKFVGKVKHLKTRNVKGVNIASSKKNKVSFYLNQNLIYETTLNPTSYPWSNSLSEESSLSSNQIFLECTYDQDTKKFECTY